ncbi:MAG: hypothetical protein CMJ14_05565 [Pelagibacterales bacterium]|nr:hypothetical protein [Pelagibacterales bacterium]|tara:strand:+ start:1076 stop:1753 length:678 start_codon:yes stop_codon:yes gene_type:complete
MKLIFKYISFFVLLFTLHSCGFGELRNEIYHDFVYKKPIHNPIDKYSVTINKRFDDVWKKLIRHAGATFFAIDNFEKDSGLLTLSFGAADISEFIDGGDFYIEQKFRFTMRTKLADMPEPAPPWRGEYVDYLENFTDTSLTGKANIVVTKIDEENTMVSVNARYIFDSRRGNVRKLSWVFDSGSCDTVNVEYDYGEQDGGNHVGGYDRKICPTYHAEQSIINSLN